MPVDQSCPITGEEPGSGRGAGRESEAAVVPVEPQGAPGIDKTTLADVEEYGVTQHAPSEPEQPGPDHLLCGLHPGITAAQDPGRLGGEPS